MRGLSSGELPDATIERVVAWLAPRPDVRAVALVGSHARGDAGPASDIDLVVLCDEPGVYVDDDSWPAELGGDLIRTRRWGDLVERRLRLDGLEAELDLGFVAPPWNPPARLRQEAIWIVGDPKTGCGMP